MAVAKRLLCALWAFAAMPLAASETYSDAEVKAAFVLRFASYVQWPAGAAPEGTFVIAVLGRGEVAGQLQRLAGARPLHGLPVQVRNITRLADAAGAQVLFVESGSLRRVRSGLRAQAERGVLIVSDEPGGLATGSTINFLLADGRVRFEVALGAARREGFKISPELLSVAARVTE